MSPTDFTGSHGLFVRVCLNLPQISQILYSLVEFPYLCKSVDYLSASPKNVSHRFHRFSQIVGVRLS